MNDTEQRNSLDLLQQIKFGVMVNALLLFSLVVIVLIALSGR